MRIGCLLTRAIPRDLPRPYSCVCGARYSDSSIPITKPFPRFLLTVLALLRPCAPAASADDGPAGTLVHGLVVVVAFQASFVFLSHSSRAFHWIRTVALLSFTLSLFSYFTYYRAFSHESVDRWYMWPARQFRPQLFHLDRVYVLDDARNLQRSIVVFSIVEEEQKPLGKRTVREDEGDVRL